MYRLIPSAPNSCYNGANILFLTSPDAQRPRLVRSARSILRATYGRSDQGVFAGARGRCANRSCPKRREPAVGQRRAPLTHSRWAQIPWPAAPGGKRTGRQIPAGRGCAALSQRAYFKWDSELIPPNQKENLCENIGSGIFSEGHEMIHVRGHDSMTPAAPRDGMRKEGRGRGLDSRLASAFARMCPINGSWRQ